MSIEGSGFRENNYIKWLGNYIIVIIRKQFWLRSNSGVAMLEIGDLGVEV